MLLNKLKFISFMLISLSLFITILGCSSGSVESTPTPVAKIPSPPLPSSSVASAPMSTNESSSNQANSSGLEVEVEMQDPGGSGEYIYSPANHKFKVGDEITFVLTSETEFHSFTIDDLNIDASVDAGEEQRVTITFDKAGTYPIICIPHETLGMIGEITVE